jgi:hypothetical protein
MDAKVVEFRVVIVPNTEICRHLAIDLVRDCIFVTLKAQ